MKHTHTPAQFLTLSKQLIAASPSTTKVTVTYHADVLGKGTVTLKTYDPATGAVINFRTNKVADVGRMVGTLGRVGRVQAGLKDGMTPSRRGWRGRIGWSGRWGGVREDGQ